MGLTRTLFGVYSECESLDAKSEHESKKIIKRIHKVLGNPIWYQRTVPFYQIVASRGIIFPYRSHYDDQ